MTRINKTELAKKLNKSQAYISKLIKSGKLKFGADNLIDEQEALNQISASKERVKLNDKENVQEVSKDSLMHFKTETEKWKAKREQLEYEMKRGSLVSIQEVENDAFEIAKNFKEEILSIPERLCNIVAAESDPLVVRELMLKEIKSSLTSLANKLESIQTTGGSK